MTILHRLVRLVVLITLAVIGYEVAINAATTLQFDGFLALLAAERMTVFWLAICLFLLALLFALSGMNRKERSKFLRFENEGGSVSIETDAIADYIGKLKKEFPSVIWMRARVIPRKREVDLLLNVRVKAGPQIHDICEALQQRTREVMSSGLGISQVRRVEVNVTEINSEHKSE